MVAHLIGILELPDEGLSSVINGLCGTNFRFSDPVKKFDEIKRCINRSASIKLNLDLKTIELEDMVEKMKKYGEKKPTEEYFEDILIALTDFSKVAVTLDISTYQFFRRLTRMNKILTK